MVNKNNNKLSYLLLYITLLLLNLVLPINGTIGCKDDNGNNVEWWVIKKFPETNNYIYFDNLNSIQFKKELNNQGSGLAQTLNSLDSSNTNYFMFNDQPWYDNQTNGFIAPKLNVNNKYNGMGKGIVAFDQAGANAIYLKHSLEGFPIPVVNGSNSPSGKPVKFPKDFPTTWFPREYHLSEPEDDDEFRLSYGHTFMCVSTSSINNLSPVFSKMPLYIYADKLSSSWRSSLQSIYDGSNVLTNTSVKINLDSNKLISSGYLTGIWDTLNLNLSISAIKILNNNNIVQLPKNFHGIYEVRLPRDFVQTNGIRLNSAQWRSDRDRSAIAFNNNIFCLGDVNIKTFNYLSTNGSVVCIMNVNTSVTSFFNRITYKIFNNTHSYSTKQKTVNYYHQVIFKRDNLYSSSLSKYIAMPSTDNTLPNTKLVLLPSNSEYCNTLACLSATQENTNYTTDVHGFLTVSKSNDVNIEVHLYDSSRNIVVMNGNGVVVSFPLAVLDKVVNNQLTVITTPSKNENNLIFVFRILQQLVELSNQDILSKFSPAKPTLKPISVSVDSQTQTLTLNNLNNFKLSTSDLCIDDIFRLYSYYFITNLNPSLKLDSIDLTASSLDSLENDETTALLKGLINNLSIYFRNAVFPNLNSIEKQTLSCYKYDKNGFKNSQIGLDQRFRATYSTGWVTSYLFEISTQPIALKNLYENMKKDDIIYIDIFNSILSTIYQSKSITDFNNAIKFSKQVISLLINSTATSQLHDPTVMIGSHVNRLMEENYLFTCSLCKLDQPVPLPTTSTPTVTDIFKSKGICDSDIKAIGLDAFTSKTLSQWVNPNPEDPSSSFLWSFIYSNVPATPPSSFKSISMDLKNTLSVNDISLCQFGSIFDNTANQYPITPQGIIYITETLLNYQDSSLYFKKYDDNQLVSYYLGKPEQTTGIVVLKYNDKICNAVNSSLSDFNDGTVLKYCPTSPIVNSTSALFGSPSKSTPIDIFGQKLFEDGVTVYYGKQNQVLNCNRLGMVSNNQRLQCSIPPGLGKSTITIKNINTILQSPTSLSKNTFTFKYNEPHIESIQSNDLPLLKTYGSVVSIFGSNFFASNIDISNIHVMIGEEKIVPTSGGYYQGKDFITFISDGVGIGNIVSIHVSNTSNPKSEDFKISYKAPIISSISDVNRLWLTHGLEKITIYGSSFGSSSRFGHNNINVLIGGKLCIETIRVNDNTAICTIPSNVGTNHAISIQVGDQMYTSTIEVSYQKPTIVQMIAPPICNTGIGGTIWIAGMNLGSETEIPKLVTDKPDHVLFNCRFSFECNFGTRPSPQFPFVCYNGVEDLRNTTEADDEDVYVNPDPNPGSGTGDDSNPDNDDEYDDSEFGKPYPVFDPYDEDSIWFLVDSYEPIFDMVDDYEQLECMKCQIFAGVGLDTKARIIVGNQTSDFTKENITFLPPSIESYYVNDTLTNSNVSCTTDGQCDLRLNGTNFPPNEAWVHLLYDQRGKAYDIVTPNFDFNSSRTNLSIGYYHLPSESINWHNSSSIFTQVPAGVGSNLNISLYVGTQLSVYNQTYSYLPPSIQNISTSNTTGNEVVSISGHNFIPLNRTFITDNDFNCSYVLIDGRNCSSPEWINSTYVNCKVGPGIGKNLTVDVYIGNQKQINNTVQFSYRPPSLSPIEMTDTKGGVITVHGNNFVPKDVNPVNSNFTVNNVSCQPIDWIDENRFSCQIQPGIGKNLSTSLYVGNQTATNDIKFSYKPPSLSSIEMTDTKGGVITVLGDNLVPKNVDPINSNFTVNNVSCKSIDWIDEKSFSCQIQPGIGRNLSTSLYVGNQTSTNDIKFSYRPPSLSSIEMTETKGGIITVIGNNLVPKDVDPINSNFTVNNVSCQSINWIDENRFSCQVQPGIGKNLSTSLYVGNQTATNDIKFSYKPPSLSSIEMTDTKGGVITVHGNNLVPKDVDPINSNFTINNVSCQPIDWIDENSFSCQVQPGIGKNLSTSLYVGNQNGTNNIKFSYKPPSLSSIEMTDTKGGIITVFGNNLVPKDVDPINSNFTVNNVSCQSINWIDENSFSCQVQPGIGKNLSTSLYVGNQNGTNNIKFSYKPPSLSSIEMTDTKGGIITVFGKNLVPEGVDPINSNFTVNNVSCQSINWIDENSFSCQVQPGIGKNISISLFVGNQTATNDIKFSYNQPTISSVSNSSTQGSTITIKGTNLVPVNIEPKDSKVTIDFNNKKSECKSIVWKDDQEIQCQSIEGTGADISIEVIIGNQSVSSKYSFDKPTVTNNQYSGSTSGGDKITIVGTNFVPQSMVNEINGQSQNQQYSVYIGAKQCQSIKWIDHTKVECTIPQGEGKDKSIDVTVAGQTNEKNTYFTYSAPTLSKITPSKGRMSKQTRVQIDGNNFGMEPTVKIGDNQCQIISNTQTTIICNTPTSSSESSQFVNVTVKDGRSTKEDVKFTYYGPPKIDSISPTSGSIMGGYDITVFGKNFQEDGSTLTAFFDNYAVPIKEQSNTRVIFTSRKGYGNAIGIFLTLADQRSNDNKDFNFNGPTVSSISPGTGKATTAQNVKIQGSDLALMGYPVDVKVGTQSCTGAIVYYDAKTISCTIPPGTTGTFAVSVVFQGKQSNIDVTFSRDDDNDSSGSSHSSHENDDECPAKSCDNDEMPDLPKLGGGPISIGILGISSISSIISPIFSSLSLPFAGISAPFQFTPLSNPLSLGGGSFPDPFSDFDFSWPSTIAPGGLGLSWIKGLAGAKHLWSLKISIHINLKIKLRRKVHVDGKPDEIEIIFNGKTGNLPLGGGDDSEGSDDGGTITITTATPTPSFPTTSTTGGTTTPNTTETPTPTPTNTSSTPTPSPTTPAPIIYTIIQGTIFIDRNTNNRFDSGDSLVKSLVITIRDPAGGINMIKTDYNGHYSLATPYVGIHNISIPTDLNFVLPYQNKSVEVIAAENVVVDFSMLVRSTQGCIGTLKQTGAVGAIATANSILKLQYGSFNLTNFNFKLDSFVVYNFEPICTYDLDTTNNMINIHYAQSIKIEVYVDLNMNGIIDSEEDIHEVILNNTAQLFISSNNTIYNASVTSTYELHSIPMSFEIDVPSSGVVYLIQNSLSATEITPIVQGIKYEPLATTYDYGVYLENVNNTISFFEPVGVNDSSSDMIQLNLPYGKFRKSFLSESGITSDSLIVSPSANKSIALSNANYTSILSSGTNITISIDAIDYIEVFDSTWFDNVEEVPTEGVVLQLVSRYNQYLPQPMMSIDGIQLNTSLVNSTILNITIPAYQGGNLTKNIEIVWNNIQLLEYFTITYKAPITNNKTIQGFVYIDDLILDNQYQINETLVDGVVLRLFNNQSGINMNTTTTNGTFIFNDLELDTYILTVEFNDTLLFAPISTFNINLTQEVLNVSISMIYNSTLKCNTIITSNDSFADLTLQYGSFNLTNYNLNSSDIIIKYMDDYCKYEINSDIINISYKSQLNISLFIDYNMNGINDENSTTIPINSTSALIITTINDQYQLNINRTIIIDQSTALVIDIPTSDNSTTTIISFESYDNNMTSLYKNYMVRDFGNSTVNETTEPKVLSAEYTIFDVPRWNTLEIQIDSNENLTTDATAIQLPYGKFEKQFFTNIGVNTTTDQFIFINTTLMNYNQTIVLRELNSTNIINFESNSTVINMTDITSLEIMYSSDIFINSNSTSNSSGLNIIPSEGGSVLVNISMYSNTSKLDIIYNSQLSLNCSLLANQTEIIECIIPGNENSTVPTINTINIMWNNIPLYYEYSFVYSEDPIPTDMSILDPSTMISIDKFNEQNK